MKQICLGNKIIFLIMLILLSSLVSAVLTTTDTLDETPDTQEGPGTITGRQGMTIRANYDGTVESVGIVSGDESRVCEIYNTSANSTVGLLSGSAIVGLLCTFGNVTVEGGHDYYIVTWDVGDARKVVFKSPATLPENDVNVNWLSRAQELVTKQWDNDTAATKNILNITITTDITITNSSWNVTSLNTFSENSSVWSVSGTTNISSNLLTFTVTTSENTNGSCRIGVEQNYTQMFLADSNYQFATTNTNNHSYTVFDNMSVGQQCLYCSFRNENGDGTVGGSSTSGCLNLTHWGSMNVTLDYPNDGYTFNVTTLDDTNVELNFTVIFHNPIINSSLWMNTTGTWEINQTITAISNNTETNFTPINLSDGSYTWNVQSCSDKICNFSSSNYTFNIDLTIINVSGNFSITNDEFPDDWESYSHLQFDLVGDDSDNILKIHLKDDDGVTASQIGNFSLDFTNLVTRNISFRDTTLWNYAGGTFNFSAMNETKFEIQSQSNESGEISIDNIRIYNYTVPAKIWANCLNDYGTAVNLSLISQRVCNSTALNSTFIFLWIDYLSAVFGTDFDLDITGEQS